MTRLDDRTRLLTRTFFGRLFESELMPPGASQMHLVIWGFAFLTAPAAFGPILFAKKYVWIHDAAVLRVTMAQDRLLVILLSMVATAFVTLAIWENIFPDRRDSRTLGVLPVPLRSFIVARLSALGLLFALFFAGTSAFGALTFGVVGTAFNATGGFFGVAAAHFLATAAAQASVFFGILVAQCALLNVAGPSTAHRLAVLLQVLVVMVVLQLPAFLPSHEDWMAHPGAFGWAERTSLAAAPMWFLAIYECVAGGGWHALRPLVLLGAAAGIGLPLLALGLYAGSYRRLTRLAIEGRPLGRDAMTSTRESRLSSIVGRAVWNPPAAAVCVFTLRTLSRSRQHRMLFSGWIGVALALIMSTAAASVMQLGRGIYLSPRPAILAAPLILAALTLTGSRMLFAIPTELKANWTFRLGEPVCVGDAIDGAALALVACGVLPAILLAFLSAGWLWGIWVGLFHAIFCGLMGLLAVQLLMRGVDKVPFTCTYAPGKAQVVRYWPVYLVAFSTFTITAAYLEIALMQSAGGVLIGLGFLAIILVITETFRRRSSDLLVQLRFEEEPLDSPTLVTLT